MKRFWHVLRILTVLSVIVLVLGGAAALAQGEDPPESSSEAVEGDLDGVNGETPTPVATLTPEQADGVEKAIESRVLEALNQPISPEEFPSLSEGLPSIQLVGIEFDQDRLTLDLSTEALELGEQQLSELLRYIDQHVSAELDALQVTPGSVFEYYILIEGTPVFPILAEINAPLTTLGIQGKKIVLSPGHGRYDNGGSAWPLQRAYYWNIVEDFINSDLVAELNPKVRAYGADPRPARQLDKSAGNHSPSNRPWWEIDGSEYIRSLGAPDSVWKPGGLGGKDRDIASRPEYANWISADAMVSIHNNGGGGANCNSHGTETWYDTSNGYQSSSQRLATVVHNKIITRIRASYDSNWCNRGVKGANGNYGENRRFRGPAIIVELAFMDVQSDNNALKDARFRSIVTTAIADGIAEYFGASGASCPTITAWKGEYWNNKDLAGNPILCRNDANVNFDWGTGGPGGGVPNDGFSARWTRDLSFSGGRYRFHLAGDDGIRLWLDGNIIIDQWKDQGRTEYTADRDLGAGNHNLRVQYYENGGGANVSLWWDYLGGGPSGYAFCANENQRCSFSGTRDVAYGANGRFNYRYNVSNGIDCNNNVFGDPIPGTIKACYTRASSCTDAAAFVGQSNYPTVSPGQGFQIYFEVRNTGACTWRQGDNYYLGNVNGTTFGANARQDLGSDVPPNSVKRWTMNMTAPGAPGSYRTQWMVKHGDATFGPNMYIDVTVTGASCPTITAWKGEYWNNKDLAGNPILCRNDANVNFDWGTGGPGGGVPNDGFSARWTRDLSFNGGRYRFHLAGDDGIRLWLDGNIIIDQWKDQGRTEYTADRDLGAGNHNLRVQYYENGGGANVSLWWDYLGGSGGGNIAANKSSWATSQESSSYPPRNGNDGNTGTRWSSQISSTLGPQWFKIDLGSAQTFNRFVARWEWAYGAHYWFGWCDVNCTSNDSTWYGFERWLSSRQDDTIDFGSQTHRYIGILMLERAPRMQNYSLWEFEAYNRTALTGEEGEVLEPSLESPVLIELPVQLPETETPPSQN